MTNILLIETATKACSVGWLSDNKLVSLREDNSMQYSHSRLLTSFIEEIADESGKELKELDALAVSMGPGSYTGLRIGVSAAKGICYALDLPLIAVNTLTSLTHLAHEVLKVPQIDFYIPMIDARRMEVYCSVFDKELNEVRNTQAEIIDENSFKDFLEKGKTAFFGDGAGKCQEVIKHKNAMFVNDLQASVKGMVGEVQVRFEKRIFEDLAYFEPYYLKDFVAGAPKIKGLK